MKDPEFKDLEGFEDFSEGWFGDSRMLKISLKFDGSRISQEF